jgi:hypothetical protein
LKYWRGFLVAAIIGVVTMAISALAKEYSLLVDMVYPYVSRMILTTLADWSATVDFTLWQVLAVLMIVGLLATIVLMIVLKWNFFQWLGWVMAGLSLLWCVHTGVWGLNHFASPLAEDLRLQVTEYTLKELESAEGKPVKAVSPIQEDDQVSMLDLSAQQVAEALKQLNVETLTPIEAMNELYKLKKMLN